MTSPLADRLRVALQDRYRLEHELGAGGMATVWLAHDLRHDRPVALKVLRPELTAVLGAERFLAEIRLTARLDHPHILTLIDSGETDGLLYYVLPYVRGESLRARLEREKQLPIDEAVRLVRQVAGALAHAHRGGVIHRDIKPENILLHEGEAVVTDFGIALALREAGGRRLTETGLSLGTPQYMSPEQATGDRDLDARSDVYSLGAVLYELLAGDPPHAGATVQAVIAKLLAEKPSPLRTLRDTVPPALEAVILRALAKVPADRFATATEFSEALGAALAAPAAVAAAAPTRAPRWPYAVAAAGVVLAATAWLRPAAPRGEAEPASALQITFSGNVLDAAISPDGTRLALSRQLCERDDLCSTSISLQDVGGGTSLQLVDRLLAVYALHWSSDGRWLFFEGADPSGRFGLYRVSTLGGAPQHLGSYMSGNPWGAGDSALVRWPSGDGFTVGIFSVADRAIVDSAPLGRVNEMTISPDGRRIAVLVRVTGDAPRLRLYDRRWRVTDSMPLPDALPALRFDGDGSHLFWRREVSANRADLRRIGVDRVTGRFAGREAQLTSAMDVPSTPGEHLGVGSDGRAVVVAGPTDFTVSLLERDGAGLPTTARPLESRTTAAQAYPSPDARAVIVTRPVVRGTTRFVQLIERRLDGGAEREVSPPLSDFRDLTWRADAGAVVYAETDTSGGTLFTLWDAATGARRPYHRMGARDGTLFWLGASGDLVMPSSDRRSIEIWAPGAAAPRITAQISLDGGINVLAPSPTTASVVTMTWSDHADSLVFGRFDEASGTWTELGRAFAEGPGSMRWTLGGRVVFSLTESASETALFELDPQRGSLRRIGRLPLRDATYNLSADGRTLTAVARRARADVWLVQPTAD